MPIHKQEERRRLLLSFFLPFLTAFFIFLPFLVIGKGFFTYCGDFNSQQIPFYLYGHDFIKSGGGSFSWASDLGGSFLNSYSFYTLGSPFFWLTMLLPSAAVPYAMAPLLMIKFGTAGLGAYLYLRRYTKQRKWALLGALLYCFSGWGIYDIFFNHFIDCMALFPFLLWSMDEFVYEKRRGVFPVFVMLNVLCNYFFFLGQVVFLVLYFVIKLLSKDYRLRLSEFFNLVLEAALGCMMGCMLIFPAAASLLQNPRTTSYANGYGLLLYGKVQQYFAILVSLFLPPDPPYLPNLFKDCNIKWTSMSLYLPLFGASGVIAYLRSRKKTANKRILWVCLVMALVPVLNSSFYALNSSYYARWYYMPLLIMALCTVQALEYTDIDLSLGIKPTVCVLIAVSLFGLVPTKVEDRWQIGGLEEPAQFAGVLLFAVVGILAVWCFTTMRRNQQQYFRRLLAAVLAFSVLYGVVHIAIGKFPQYETDYNYKAECYDTIGKVELADDHFYRTDTYECYDNLGLFWDMPCIRSFNSTVTPSILEFYPSIGVKRDVSSKPDLDHYALRGLLSVEYLLTPLDTKDELAQKPDTGFVFDYESGGYAIFRNENYVPMGFTLDYYMTADDAADVPKDKLANVMLRAILLSDEQIAEYGQYFTRATSEQLSGTSYALYAADCADRAAHSCDSFVATRSGFTATITLDRDNLVLFSVPYDEGFRATVNGKRVPVLKVDNGLTAIPAGAGANEIVLTLTPTWLRLAQLLTGTGFAVYLGYLVYLYKKRGAPAERIVPLEVRLGVPTVAEQDAARQLQHLLDAESCTGDCAGCTGCGAPPTTDPCDETESE